MLRIADGGTASILAAASSGCKSAVRRTSWCRLKDCWCCFVCRIGGSGVEQSGADHSLRFELGNCLLVLIPAPINVASLMKGGRRPEKLVQALGQQRVFAAFFVGNLMTRRARRWCPS